MQHVPIEVFSNLEQLSRRAANLICEYSEQTLRQQDSFSIALAGGNTPKSLYGLLAQESFARRIDWRKWHVYFGDERMVAPQHPDSNYGMAYNRLLHNVTIPPAQVHPIPTHCGQAEECARLYADTLQQMPGPRRDGMPVFDLVLLGMGADGHTASLFPGTTVLQERAQSVAAVYVDKFQSWRITLTYPVLNQARKILVLVTGQDKAGMIRRIFTPGAADTQVPIQGLRPQGELQWFLDQSAASELPAQA